MKDTKSVKKDLERAEDPAILEGLRRLRAEATHLRADGGAIETAHAAAVRALERRPAPAVTWRRHAAAMTAMGLAVTLLGALATARLGGVAAELTAARLPAIAVLLVAQALALWSAIAPGRGRVLAWAATAIGAALLLQARGGSVANGLASAAAASDAPGWICSASHLGVGLLPAIVMLALLRGISWSLARAVTAGLAIGISGLIWGEIACERSFGHVVVHHFGAMVLMTVACAMVARRVSRGAFAP